MGKALDEEAGGLTELAKGPMGDTLYFWQGPERPTDGCASWGTKGPICLFRLVFVIGGNLGCSAVCPPLTNRLIWRKRQYSPSPAGSPEVRL
jgi:hypothetical protein